MNERRRGDPISGGGHRYSVRGRAACLAIVLGVVVAHAETQAQRGASDTARLP